MKLMMRVDNKQCPWCGSMYRKTMKSRQWRETIEGYDFVVVRCGTCTEETVWDYLTDKEESEEVDKKEQ